MTTGGHYYAQAEQTLADYEAERAKGKSAAQAIGTIAGGIGGVAGCTAVGAGFAAPLCASLGASIGSAIGSILSPQKRDDGDAICAEVGKNLNAMRAEAAARGIEVSAKDLQVWWADAANRAWMARYSLGAGMDPVTAPRLIGTMGEPGAYVRSGGYMYGLNDDGAPDANLVKPLTPFAPMPPPLGKGSLPFVMLFMPRGYGRCIPQSVKVDDTGGEVAKAASIGLVAAGIRLEAERKMLALPLGVVPTAPKLLPLSVGVVPVFDAPVLAKLAAMDLPLASFAWVGT